MGALLTVGLTMLVLLIVLVPVTALATRGRRQFGRIAQGDPRLALGPTVRVDPGVEDLYRATRGLIEALVGPARLGPEYAKVIPVLEVMDGARSSPRVYPSNWIGDLMDAFDEATESADGAAAVWLAAWAATSGRARAELLESAAAFELVRKCLSEDPFRPVKIRSNAFTYLSHSELKRLQQRCESLESAGRAGLIALVELRSSPYR